VEHPARIVMHARRLGSAAIVAELRRRLSSAEVNFGLRCDLERLPPLVGASMPLTLECRDGHFAGFQAELDRTTGADYGRTLRRQRLHEKGVRSMYVAVGEDGAPVYVQWLVTPDDQHLLDEHGSDFWPRLEPDELLVEFAYTFTPFRGLGVMGDAMRRLLGVGEQLGARWARTYVRDDNVPSLRGCAKVGFDLDHVRTTTTRLGTRRNRIRPPSDAERRHWEQASAPRRRA
jgi:RimJ/RimL family protein N-acetyltransferase